MLDAITWHPRVGEPEQTIEVGIGLYTDGRLAEVFATARKSDQDAIIADACVLISIALQFGVPPAAYLNSIGRQALPRHKQQEDPDAIGPPLTPIGAIVELLSDLDGRRALARTNPKMILGDHRNAFGEKPTLPEELSAADAEMNGRPQEEQHDDNR